MQTLRYFAFTFLCSLSFLSAGVSIKCNETQYEWPVVSSQWCCNMCPPGQRMVRRSEDSCKIECEPCTRDQYTDTHNTQLSCNFCESCNKPNMELESQCIPTLNTVCRCKAGYRCKDQPCTQCVRNITTTTTTTLPPSTTALKPGALTTLWKPPKPIRDTVWSLVIITLVCAVVALVVVAKIKPFLRWIRSKLGNFLAEKPAPETTYSEDKEVSTPIQEACGKCDQLLDVRVSD